MPVFAFAPASDSFDVGAALVAAVAESAALAGSAVADGPLAVDAADMGAAVAADTDGAGVLSVGVLAGSGADVLRAPSA